MVFFCGKAENYNGTHGGMKVLVTVVFWLVLVKIV
jgi:hypothetical protein